MGLIETFLLRFMPYAEIEWYLGFGLLGMGLSALLGAFVFEVKKQARWIGAFIGVLATIAVLIICLIVRPYVPEGRFWGISPGTMLTLSFVSCVSVTLPLYGLIWLLVKEGKSKNMENPLSSREKSRITAPCPRWNQGILTRSKPCAKKRNLTIMNLLTDSKKGLSVVIFGK